MLRAGRRRGSCARWATSATAWRRRFFGVLKTCCMPTHAVHHGTAALSCCSQGGRGGAWRAWGERLAPRIWCDGAAAWQRALKLVAQTGRACRAAEEELCAIGDERDRLAPQVEEARWHARRAEKDAAAARAERDALQTARTPCAHEHL